MLIDTAYRKYSGPMLQAMIRFSRMKTAANDAVSQAFTQALINRAMLESMPEPAMRAWLYAAARNALVDMKRKEARLVSRWRTPPRQKSRSPTPATGSWRRACSAVYPSS